MLRLSRCLPRAVPCHSVATQRHRRSTIESLGTLIGPLLAGVLVSVADVGSVFAVGGAAFLVAALLLARVRVEGRIEVTGAAAAESMRNVILAGYRVVARTAKLRLIIGLVIAQTFVRGCPTEVRPE